jgi:hypothetical protein
VLGNLHGLFDVLLHEEDSSTILVDAANDPERYLSELTQRNAFQPLPRQLRHSLHLPALPSLHAERMRALTD